MLFQKDTTYNEIREKSLLQWLEQMESHEDVAVRGGVPLVRNYLNSLQKEIETLKQENELKNQYLRKVSRK